MQEWYLMTSNTRPNLTGGFENDTYLNYKEDAFAEVLGTDMASTIILYNSNLTKSVTLRSIVQSNVSDSQQKSTERQCLLQIGASEDYTYAFFEGNYWLMINYVGNNGLYEKAIVRQCNYTLKFQHPITGTILSYPCITSGKSYSNDENKVITLPSNQKSVLLPFSDDTKTLKTDKRLFIDKLNETPFAIVGSVDNTSFSFGNKGLIYFVTEQRVLQEQDGTLPKDRPDLGICNYFKPTVVPDPTPIGDNYSKITSSGDITIDSTRIITTTAYNPNNTVNTSVNLIWVITKPIGYKNDITCTIVGNTCTIKVVENYDLIDLVIKFEVSDGNGGYSGSQEFIIGV